MRVPDVIRKCVGFIAVREATGLRHLGTGFIVSIPGSFGNQFGFLVTARHIAEQIESRDWLLRVNTTNGQTVELDARPNSSKWYYHQTERRYVDAAVTLIAPPKREGLEVDFRPVPTSMFIKEESFEEKGIGVGDEIFIAGLFNKVIETSHVMPIIRMGNVAMIPGEKIPNGNSLIEAYLIESRSIGGLSGSPVFVRETLKLQTMNLKPGADLSTVSDRYPGESFGRTFDVAEMLGVGRYYLFGSAVGHWDVPTGAGNEAVNMGISMVTPAGKILEILMQPELKDLMRKGDEVVRRIRADATRATEDSTNIGSAFTEDQLDEVLKAVKE